MRRQPDRNDRVDRAGGVDPTGRDDRVDRTGRPTVRRRQFLGLTAAAATAAIAGCGYQPAGGERVWTTDGLTTRGTVLSNDRYVFSIRNHSGTRYDFDENEWVDAEETVLTAYGSSGDSAFTVRFEPQYAGVPKATTDRVVLPGDDGSVVAVSVDRDPEIEADERVDWRTDRTFDAHPIVLDVGPSIVVGQDGGDRFLAFDFETGEELWDRSGSPDGAVPVGIGERICCPIESTDGTTTLRGIDVANGTEQWSQPIDGFAAGVVDRAPAPVVVDRFGLVIAADGDGTLLAIDSEEGTEQWRSTIGRAVDRPLVTEETVYAPTGDDIVACDPTEGEPRWSLPDGYSVSGGVVADSDGLYFAGGSPRGSSHRIVGVRPDGEVWWEAPLGEDVGGVDDLYLIGDRLVVRSGGELYGLRKRPGSRWSVL